ncbi:hypothetical protein [Streptomyces sp. NBC_00554]|uniref:hypothetical protein n=1 Tax=unclassified Streptomyces TaxID=2593676 RepID=UPI00352E69A3|nr:hypothetical protein OG256_19045 [Streptomyces sp. NBC_00564]WUC51596.1 hypothetical protein OG266_25790 [Streptomyces sp. NBC_00554]
MRTPIVRAALACLLLTGLAACQENGDKNTDKNTDKKTSSATAARASTAPSVSPWTCDKQSIHWGRTQQRQQLVAASQLVKATSGMKGSEVWFSVIPVRTVKASVETSVSVKADQETLLASLEKHMGVEEGTFARPGTAVPLPDTKGEIAINLEGQEAEYASAIGATVVEADFVYGCASSTATPVFGTVTTWHKRAAGMIECGTDPRRVYMREVYSLLCGEEATTEPSASVTPSA